MPAWKLVCVIYILPKFFEDQNENEDEKRSGKKHGRRRLKKCGDQQTDDVARNDGDQRTFHGVRLPMFSPAANQPKREQARRAATGVNEHI